MDEEKKMHQELLKWYLRREKFKNKDYELLPPEYNPQESNSATEIGEFIDGVIEGLRVAYSIYSDNDLFLHSPYIGSGILAILENEMDTNLSFFQCEKIAKKLLEKELEEDSDD